MRVLGKESITNKVIDTLSLARKTLNTRVANLDYLCRRFSIDLAERKIHGALLDSQLLAEVYLELLGGKQISMNLSTPNYKNKSTTLNINKSELIFTKLKTTKDEILQHKTSIKQIKNSLWEKIY